ncbi:hypothetical protein [Rothia sp. ZJ932]|uniref:hypothetical protein n=1 Tax=Rothia sp. ZJ932 TaxID=2810516 RepID=UPI001967E35E|nr:hypothetical protein [Rothia sp. ZJ932]QRZ61785.1 hypothetical protein JR346_01185 [Rothia sp. ZJ932]
MKIAPMLTLIAATTFAVVGCSSPDKPEEEPSQTPEPIVSAITYQGAPSSHAASEIADGTCFSTEGVDRTDPTEVARAFTLISYCWDSVHDRTTTAATLRAKDLMNEQWVQNLVEPERNAYQSMFNTAYQHQSYTSVHAELAPTDLNSSEGDRVTRVFLVDFTWQGRDGSVGSSVRLISTVYVEKNAEGKYEVTGQQMHGFEER